MRTLHIFNLLLALTLIGLSAYVYPELPAQIPAHFGADGEVTRWSERSWWGWMLLPLIGVASVALMYVIGAFAPSRPHLVNVPDRKRYDQLSPQGKKRVVAAVMDSLYMLGTALLLMFSLLQYGAWRAAVAGDGGSYTMTGVIFGLVSSPFFMIVLFLKMQRAMDDAWRRDRESASTAA